MSSGLTKRMFATVASSSSAAPSAAASMLPNERIASRFVRRDVVRRTSPLPTGSAVMAAAIATPGPLPRGYRTAAGVSSLNAV